jgi:hypothetical protein
MLKYFGIVLLLTIIVFTSTGSIAYLSSPDSSMATLDRLENKIKLSRVNFEDSVKSLYTEMSLEKQGLNYDAFRYGIIGFNNLKLEGKLKNLNLISIIDFTKKSTEKRFYTLDLAQRKVVFHSLVSHGKNTGENEAKQFSNVSHSNQSSLGFYITGETYVGSKGYSLRLDGADGVFNSNMRSRAVVMHEADYVSEDWIKRYGRLGRSQGCPALPKELSRKVIDTIKDKSLIFAYFKDDTYLSSSAHLDLERLWAKLEQTQVIPSSI